MPMGRPIATRDQDDTCHLADSRLGFFEHEEQFAGHLDLQRRISSGIADEFLQVLQITDIELCLDGVLNPNDGNAAIARH
jgi:hypothetical protein